MNGHTPSSCFTRQLAAMSACNTWRQLDGDEHNQAWGAAQGQDPQAGWRAAGRQEASHTPPPSPTHTSAHLHHHTVKVLRTQAARHSLQRPQTRGEV